MIWLDLPLVVTAIFFFVISFAYSESLLFLKIFGYSLRDHFAWDLAATVGIASVVSCTYAMVWVPRATLGYDPIPELAQIPYDLAVVFIAALPGMTLHRVRLNEYRKRQHQNKNSQLVELKSQIREILTQQKEAIQMLEEVLAILGLRNEAMEYLNKTRDEYKN